MKKAYLLEFAAIFLTVSDIHELEMTLSNCLHGIFHPPIHPHASYTDWNYGPLTPAKYVSFLYSNFLSIFWFWHEAVKFWQNILFSSFMFNLFGFGYSFKRKYGNYIFVKKKHLKQSEHSWTGFEVASEVVKGCQNNPST